MAKDHPAADLVEAEPKARDEALAGFIEEQTGYEPDITTVQLVTALTPQFRGSDADKEWRETAKAERDAARIEERQQKARDAYAKRAAATQEKLDKIKAEEEAKLAEIAEGGPLRRKRGEKAEPTKKAPTRPKTDGGDGGDELAARRSGRGKPATKTAAKKTAAKKTPAAKKTTKTRTPVVPSDDDF